MDFTSYGYCDLVLDSEHVFRRAIIFLRPKRALVLNLNKLHRSTKSIWTAAKTALDHILNSELTANLVKPFMTVLVSHDGCACDDSQLLGMQPTNLGNQLLGQPIGKEL